MGSPSVVYFFPGADQVLSSLVEINGIEKETS
jgi:hypothetical protein